MNNINDETLTIQQVAEATGLSEHTLRYYERVGLIHAIGRAGNGHRRYSPNDIGWIDFLTKLRSTGMSIQNMQRYAELQRLGDETLEERVQLLKDLREQAKERIEELNGHVQILNYKIRAYSETITEQKREKVK